jgi:hypothetical protein
MNLNPLESEKCLYDIGEIYDIVTTEYEDWSCTDIEQRIDLNKDHSYTYLLKSITDKIQWFIEAVIKTIKEIFSMLEKIRKINTIF